MLKNAKALAKQLVKMGFNVLTGGTDNHLVLLDLRNKGITGLELEQRLASVHIITNKNAVPFDTENKTVTSGIRLGTPAVTSRGMNEEDMKLIANLISMCAGSQDEFELYRSCVESCIKYLCDKYPLYPKEYTRGGRRHCGCPEENVLIDEDNFQSIIDEYNVEED